MHADIDAGAAAAVAPVNQGRDGPAALRAADTSTAHGRSHPATRDSAVALSACDTVAKRYCWAVMTSFPALSRAAMMRRISIRPSAPRASGRPHACRLPARQSHTPREIRSARLMSTISIAGSASSSAGSPIPTTDTMSVALGIQGLGIRVADRDQRRLPGLRPAGGVAVEDGTGADAADGQGGQRRMRHVRSCLTGVRPLPRCRWEFDRYAASINATAWAAASNSATSSSAAIFPSIAAIRRDTPFGPLSPTVTGCRSFLDPTM